MPTCWRWRICRRPRTTTRAPTGRLHPPRSAATRACFASAAFSARSRRNADSLSDPLPRPWHFHGFFPNAPIVRGLALFSMSMSVAGIPLPQPQHTVRAVAWAPCHLRRRTVCSFGTNPKCWVFHFLVYHSESQAPFCPTCFFFVFAAVPVLARRYRVPCSFSRSTGLKGLFFWERNGINCALCSKVARVAQGFGYHHVSSSFISRYTSLNRFVVLAESIASITIPHLLRGSKRPKECFQNFTE